MTVSFFSKDTTLKSVQALIEQKKKITNSQFVLQMDGFNLILEFITANPWHFFKVFKCFPFIPHVTRCSWATQLYRS